MVIDYPVRRKMAALLRAMGKVYSFMCFFIVFVCLFLNVY